MKRPDNFLLLAVSIMSYISLVLSLKCLPGMKPVCLFYMVISNVCFNLSAIAPDALVDFCLCYPWVIKLQYIDVR